MIARIARNAFNPLFTNTMILLFTPGLLASDLPRSEPDSVIQTTLAAWHAAMQSTQSVHCLFERWPARRIGSIKRESGEVWIGNGSLWRVDVFDPEGLYSEICCWSDTGYRWFNIKTRTESIFETTASGKASVLNPLGGFFAMVNEIPARFQFLFLGAPPDVLHRRFNMKITDTTGTGTAIVFEPRDKSERLFFRRLTLTFREGRPVHMIFEDAFGLSTHYRITQFDSNPPIDRSFLEQGLPTGYAKRSLNGKSFPWERPSQVDQK